MLRYTHLLASLLKAFLYLTFFTFRFLPEHASWNSSWSSCLPWIWGRNGVNAAGKNSPEARLIEQFKVNIYRLNWIMCAGYAIVYLFENSHNLTKHFNFSRQSQAMLRQNDLYESILNFAGHFPTMALHFFMVKSKLQLGL